MNYIKHTFVDGENLYPSYLNNMENQIETNSKLVAIPITNVDITFDELSSLTNELQTVFDLSSLNAGVEICSIYLDEESKFYKIIDKKTDFTVYGFYKPSDKIKDLILSSNIGTKPHHYTVKWDQTLAQMERLNDAANITLTTTNFGYFGKVNNNYDNPFDTIYPWSGRKLCNIDLDLYMSLTNDDDITDCITAWEDDVSFSYTDNYGVWVYTPPFFGNSWISNGYRYFDVTDEKLPNNIFYPASIQGRWLGIDETLTIDGTNKHCLLPKIGLPACKISLSDLHQYAKNYNATLMDIYTLDATSLLYIVEYANMNVQTKIGDGVSALQTNDYLSANVTNSTTITFSGISSSHQTIFTTPNVVVAAGNSAFTYIVSSSVSGNTITVTLADPVSCTTSQKVYAYGLRNVADENIGSKSGYIGSNTRCNSYYRGQTFFANKYRYILGAYREKNTSKIWIAEKGDCDNYDALNTSKHIETNLTLPTISGSSKEGYISELGMVDGLSFTPFAIGVGENSASSTNPVGDYSFLPSTETDDTVFKMGCRAGRANYCGWCNDWAANSSQSDWSNGAQPCLKRG